MSFQNLPKSEILIYSMKSQSLVKRLCLNTEGDNSVLGGFGGYYIADMEHIYIPSMYVSKIFVVDTAGVVKRKIDYSTTKDGQQSCSSINVFSILQKRMACRWKILSWS